MSLLQHDAQKKQCTPQPKYFLDILTFLMIEFILENKFKVSLRSVPERLESLVSVLAREGGLWRLYDREYDAISPLQLTQECKNDLCQFNKLTTNRRFFKIRDGQGSTSAGRGRAMVDPFQGGVKTVSKLKSVNVKVFLN